MKEFYSEELERVKKEIIKDITKYDTQVSKPYFTIYLPIEGEIKEGDLFFNEKSSSKKIQIFKKGGSRHFKKAKLFLCSREVPDNWDNPHVDYWDGTPEDKRYRVIGEISPEALSYIKEGDEFDKDEIVPIYWNNEEKQGLAWYAIKGPCGHFH